jgi:small nuclear ribonucleoprotein (snRNP)-like protein
MLIDVQYKKNDIVSLKLTSGEEMVARLEAETETEITIVKPYMLIANPDGQVGLAPFMFTVTPDAKFKLKINNVICIVKTAKDAADMYIKQSTGIAIATGS